MNYIVAYDRRPGVDYEPVHKLLESYPDHWRFQQSTWIIGPANSAFEVAERVRTALDAGDRLFVQALTPDSAWWGYDEPGNEWIEEMVRTASR